MAEPTIIVEVKKCREVLRLDFHGAAALFECDLSEGHDGQHDCGFDNPNDKRSTHETANGRARISVRWDLPPVPESEQGNVAG